MLARLTDWARGMRAVWDELGRLETEAKAPPAHADLAGRLGEMGHPADRADDWNPCDPGT